MPGSLRNVLILFVIVSIGIFFGCRPPDKRVCIAISKASPNYINWLKQTDSTICYVDLYPLGLEKAMEAMDTCSGLLLSGGEDVFPGLYDQASDTIRCGETDLFRDTLEINALLKAVEARKPVFGVCRGLQLINVVFGGTLFIDLPTDLDTAVIHRCADYTSCFHPVRISGGTRMKAITGCDSAIVTTNHHQGIRELAPDLRCNALSSDGLCEGIELEDPHRFGFLMAVPWHPERMAISNPLSGPLAAEWVRECREYQPDGR